ncbi:hypothetical protein ACIBO9_35790 [Streptomyces prunicolor]|uniref:hypothetical protein n=1 Tax=Streptomyces prunicolor TaxID=67348 RepID=UPI0037D4ACA3
MMVRRLFRAAAGSLTVLACGLLTACSTSTHATPSAAGTTTASVAAPAPASSMKTVPPSALCTVLSKSVAERLITGARLQARVSPDKGQAPDVCGYTAPDGQSTLSLNPTSRAYAAELSAAHNLAADPSSAGMRDVQVDTVDALGRQAFRETASQTQVRQRITFVVWNTGTRSWVLTFATTKGTSTAPTTVSDDTVVQVARSITAKLPTGG